MSRLNYEQSLTGVRGGGVGVPLVGIAGESSTGSFNGTDLVLK